MVRFKEDWTFPYPSTLLHLLTMCTITYHRCGWHGSQRQQITSECVRSDCGRRELRIPKISEELAFCADCLCMGESKEILACEMLDTHYSCGCIDRSVLHCCSGRAQCKALDRLKPQDATELCQPCTDARTKSLGSRVRSLLSHMRVGH